MSFSSDSFSLSTIITGSRVVLATFERGVTDAILAELGYEESLIAQMHENGVV